MMVHVWLIALSLSDSFGGVHPMEGSRQWELETVATDRPLAPSKHTH